MDVILDREELYREVWSRSVSTVARKYDLTEGDIRKACFALDVPRPARGYWAKLKINNAPPAPPLPQKNGASTYTCKTISRAPKAAKPKESIIDWVLRGNAELAAEKAKRSLAAEPIKRRSRHTLHAEELPEHPRYVPLTIWAQLMFGEYMPHVNTLRRWVNDGRIQPQPKKMGRYWFVKVDAEYIPD